EPEEAFTSSGRTDLHHTIDTEGRTGDRRDDFAGAESAAHLRAALLRGNTGAGPAFVALDCDPKEIPPFLPFQPFAQAAGHADRAGYADNKENADERRVVRAG
ncbi:hypothetical protein ACWEBX_39075, partial [Streptomyces sp. NPDC005070]